MVESRYGRLGMIEAKGVGFRSVVDLDASPAAVREERRIVEFALSKYYDIPVSGEPATDEQIDALAETLNDDANLPALIHGDAGDEAAAAWAPYRASQGGPPQIALEEGPGRRPSGTHRRRARAARSDGSLSPAAAAPPALRGGAGDWPGPRPAAGYGASPRKGAA